MKHHHTKRFYLFISSATVIALALFVTAFVWINNRPTIEPVFGVTFSWVYAELLGQNPVKMYERIVDDLLVKDVRLPLYWSEIEQEEGTFDWTIPDALLQLSEDHEVNLTLVVGSKVPRWPECYVPDWAEGFDEMYQQQATLSFIKEAVQRYKSSRAVIRWQVDNEPFFPFGICSQISHAQFQERIDLVRSLDDRPIQVTVSGELGPWLDSAKSADILGISMYRQTWNDLFGHFVYPLTPDYYYFRSTLIRGAVSQVVVSELQAEPWFSAPIESKPLLEWYDSFTVEMFNQNVQFAQEAGLSEAYLWGAEWWYALKEQGDDRLWEEARPLFQK